MNTINTNGINIMNGMKPPESQDTVNRISVFRPGSIRKYRYLINRLAYFSDEAISLAMGASENLIKSRKATSLSSIINDGKGDIAFASVISQDDFKVERGGDRSRVKREHINDIIGCMAVKKVRWNHGSPTSKASSKLAYCPFIYIRREFDSSESVFKMINLLRILNKKYSIAIDIVGNNTNLCLALADIFNSNAVEFHSRSLNKYKEYENSVSIDIDSLPDLYRFYVESYNDTVERGSKKEVKDN